MANTIRWFNSVSCMLGNVDRISLSCFIVSFSVFSISEYLDEAMLIPKNTSVLIRRVPGRPRMTIVTEPVIEQDEYYLNPSIFFDRIVVFHFLLLG